MRLGRVLQEWEWGVQRPGHRSSHHKMLQVNSDGGNASVRTAQGVPAQQGCDAGPGTVSLMTVGSLQMKLRFLKILHLLTSPEYDILIRCICLNWTIISGHSFFWLNRIVRLGATVLIESNRERDTETVCLWIVSGLGSFLQRAVCDGVNRQKMRWTSSQNPRAWVPGPVFYTVLQLLLWNMFPQM